MNPSYHDYLRQYYLREYGISESMTLDMESGLGMIGFQDDHGIELNGHTLICHNAFTTPLTRECHILADVIACIYWGVSVKASSVIISLIDRQDSPICVHDPMLHPHDTTIIGHTALMLLNLRRMLKTQSSDERLQTLREFFGLAHPWLFTNEVASMIVHNVRIHRFMAKNETKCKRVCFGNLDAD